MPINRASTWLRVTKHRPLDCVEACSKRDSRMNESIVPLKRAGEAAVGGGVAAATRQPGDFSSRTHDDEPRGECRRRTERSMLWSPKVGASLEEAEHADSLPKGGSKLPLLGLPVTVKDSIDVHGFRCTGGLSRFLPDISIGVLAREPEPVLEGPISPEPSLKMSARSRAYVPDEQ